ncbi:MAG: hypothetical protein JNM72_02285 [Deltaproteobacteria bacterium]|nr:hypothetical protein [Deltaproteobacteria bacterium]
MASVMKMVESAPLGAIVESVGLAIAKAQYAMDTTSIQMLERLTSRTVEIGGVERTLLELGFTPTFYAITEAELEVKISLSTSSSEEFGTSASLRVGNPFTIAAATVNASYSNKYSFSAQASSSLRTRFVALPPPAALKDAMQPRRPAASGSGTSGNGTSGSGTSGSGTSGSAAPTSVAAPAAPAAPAVPAAPAPAATDAQAAERPTLALPTATPTPAKPTNRAANWVPSADSQFAGSPTAPADAPSVKDGSLIRCLVLQPRGATPGPTRGASAQVAWAAWVAPRSSGVKATAGYARAEWSATNPAPYPELLDRVLTLATGSILRVWVPANANTTSTPPSLPANQPVVLDIRRLD